MPAAAAHVCQPSRQPLRAGPQPVQAPKVFAPCPEAERSLLLEAVRAERGEGGLRARYDAHQLRERQGYPLLGLAELRRIW